MNRASGSAAWAGRQEGEATRRIFVVGCPRSGTTLVQALVGSHPGLQTLPETHFFPTLADGSWMYRLGLAPRGALRCLRQLAGALGQVDLLPGLAHRTVPGAVGAFVRLLDAGALTAGKLGWVEKTPLHLHHLDKIAQGIPNARAVHVIRRGRDVVASLYSVTQRHPEAWGGARPLEICIDRWLNDTELSLKVSCSRNDPVVRYCDVIREPEATTERLWEVLGLGGMSFSLERFRDAAKNVKPKSAPWQDVGRSVRAASDKFETVLTAAEREYVRDRLGAEGRCRRLYWRGEPLFE